MLKATIASLAVTIAILASGTFAETPSQHAESLVRAHHAEVIALRAEGADVDKVRAHREAYEARLKPLVATLSEEEQAHLKELVLELSADRWTR